MAHVVYPNYAPNQSILGGHAANQWWMHMLVLIKAGWRYMASGGGHAAAAKDATRDPRNCRFLTPGLVSRGTGAAASIGAKTGEDVLLTGLTGLVVPSATNGNKGGSEGNFLVLSGCASGANNTIMQITEVVSTTSCRARTVITLNAAVASDANSGAITWTEYDLLGSTYNTGLKDYYKWIVLRGPSVLKVAFTASPTGTFLRGEKVTQGTAEGEIIGITWDPDTGAGWAVILHRQTGGGAAARGWATGSAVTGASSGATFTPTGVTEYVTEVCFADGHATAATRAYGVMSGWSTCCALDGGTEEAMLPSTLAGAGGLAGAAGCTASVHPGGGGTGNSFPVIGMSIMGRPEQTANAVYQHCIGNYNLDVNVPGYAQLVAANCIGRAGVSPDGTFWALFGCPGLGPYGFGGYMHARLDDTEEGDMWLFSSKAGGAAYKTVNYLTDSTSRYIHNGNLQNMSECWVPFSDYTDSQTAPTYAGWNSWRARGLVSGASGTYSTTTDRYLPTIGMYLNGWRTSQALGRQTATVAVVVASATPTLYREHPVLGADYAAMRYRKGRVRWMAYSNANAQAGDTMGGKQWVVVRDIAANDGNYLTTMIGPWDGSSTPLPG